MDAILERPPAELPADTPVRELLFVGDEPWPTVGPEARAQYGQYAQGEDEPNTSVP